MASIWGPFLGMTFTWAAFVMASLNALPGGLFSSSPRDSQGADSLVGEPPAFPTGDLSWLPSALLRGRTRTGGRVTKTGPALQAPVSGCGCLKTQLHEEEVELGQLPLLGLLIPRRKRSRSRLCVLFPYSIITHLPSEAALPSVFIFLWCNKNSITGSPAWAVSTVALNSILNRNN